MIQHKEMLSLYKQGLTLTAIGNTYGVSRQRVQQILVQFPDYVPRVIRNKDKPDLSGKQIANWQLLSYSRSRHGDMLYNCECLLCKVVYEVGIRAMLEGRSKCCKSCSKKFKNRL